MSTTVYSLPKTIKKPETDFANYNHAEYLKKEEAFLKKLRTFIKSHSSSKYNGKVVQFQVADSYAYYMVVSIRPSQVIHLPIGDEWEFQFINRLTGKDLADQIDAKEKMDKLFSK